MSTLLFVGGLGGWEIALIIAIILIFFGAKKIPELARGLGSGIREFKSATREQVKEKPADKETKAEETQAKQEEKPINSVNHQEQPANKDTPAHHA